MNKLATLLITAALISPAFAKETPTQMKKAETRKVMVRKTKKSKTPAVQSKVSALHNLDYPWQLPS